MTGAATPVVAASSTQSRPASVAPTTAPADPEADALAKLTARAAQDAARTTKQGQWMAQLASKYVGATDKYQVNSEGSHTFGAVHILAEYETLAAKMSGENLVLLDSRTYGKRHSHNGQALWVVAVVKSSFTDEASVKSWCARQFSNLSGAELNNSCMPNVLNP